MDRVALLFQEADTDGNGTLSRAEFQEVQRMYCRNQYTHWLRFMFHSSACSLLSHESMRASIHFSYRIYVCATAVSGSLRVHNFSVSAQKNTCAHILL